MNALHKEIQQTNGIVMNYLLATNKIVFDKLIRAGAKLGDVLQELLNESKCALKPLPIYSTKTQIMNFLESKASYKPFLILSGETGSGKSTQLPIYILQHLCDNPHLGKAAIIQPRKIAAKALAERVCHELPPKLARLVGSLSDPNVFANPEKKVVFMTDSQFIKELISNPKLEGYSVVVIDEAHERTTETDIILGTLKHRIVKTKELTNIKTIVVSDSRNANKIAFYLSKPNELRILGRAYPVLVKYQLPTYGIQDQVIDIANMVVKLLRYKKEILSNEQQFRKENPEINWDLRVFKGNMVVFVPSLQEMKRLKALTKEEQQKEADLPKMHKFEFVAIHLNMSYKKYLKIFENHNPNEITTIFLATKLAESSIPFSDISMVIDAGFDKVSVYSPLKRIDEVRYLTISKSSALQRFAIAGKTRPGICYRIYSEDKYQNSMREEENPEFLIQHIEKGVLMLKQLGFTKIGDCKFFIEKIPSRIIESSEERLVGYKALTGTEKTITDVGSKMWKINLAPFFSKPLFKALKFGVFHEVAKIVSILKYASTLYNVGEGEEMLKQKQTQLWKQFSSHKDYEGVEGDHFLYLFIFDEFLKYHEKSPDENGEESKIEMDASKQANSAKKWCKHHGLSYSTLKNAYSTYTELVQDFATEIENAKVSETQSTKTDRILEILLKSHLLNFCVHSNDESLGYLIARESTKLENIFIHPNSIYSGNSKKPPYIIFSELQDSGDLIASSVTGISAKSLTLFTKFPKVSKSLEALVKSIPTQLKPHTFDGLGSAVLTRFKEKMEELRTWRSDNKILFKVNGKAGSICVWSDPAGTQNLIIIKQMLERIKRELENENCEIGIYKDSRVVLKKSATLGKVLKGIEATTLITSELDEFITAEDIETSIKEKYGDSITPQVMINFDRSAERKHAVVSCENQNFVDKLASKKLKLKGRLIELKKRHLNQEVDLDRAVGVRVVWYAGYPMLGSGTIIPNENGEEKKLLKLLNGALVLNQRLKVVPGKNIITLGNQLFDVDEIFLHEFLLQSSVTHHPKVNVHRQGNQPQAIAFEKAQFDQLLLQKSYAWNGKFERLENTHGYKFIYTYVFENVGNASGFIKEIDQLGISIAMANGQQIIKMLHAFPILDTSIEIDKNYYIKFQREFKKCANSLNMKYEYYSRLARIMLPELEKLEDVALIYIEAVSPILKLEAFMRSVVEIKEEFSRMMRGTQISSLLDHKFYSLLFMNVPQLEELISMANNSELQVIRNPEDRTLFLKGDLAEIKETENALQKALNEMSRKYLVEEIDVTPFDANLLLNGGLESLRKQYTSVYISLKIKKGYFTVECLSQDKEALEKAKEDILQKYVQKIQEDKTNCSLCNHKWTKGARILNCGHSYCFKCIQLYLKELCRRKEHNWSCFRRDCQEGIIVRDIVDILSREDLGEYLRTVSAQEYQQINGMIREAKDDEIVMKEEVEQNEVLQGNEHHVEENSQKENEDENLFENTV